MKSKSIRGVQIIHLHLYQNEIKIVFLVDPGRDKNSKCRPQKKGRPKMSTSKKGRP